MDSASISLTRFNELMRGREFLQGRWELTPNHELQYRKQGGEEEIVLTGNLVAAEPAALVAQIREDLAEGETVSRLLSLRGRWQADDRNRLAFLVERQKGRHDWLTFEGAWEVGPGQEILYRYQRTEQKKGSRAVHLLRFRGYWELSEDKRLTYVLDEASDSTFRFRGTFQSPSVLPKGGSIRYQVGIEVEGRRRTKAITLFGKWKLSRNLALELEIPYGGGGGDGDGDSTRSIVFGATYQFDSRNAVTGRLATRGGRPLGVELLLTREFLQGQGEAFLRLRKSLEESAVEGGVRFRW